jgi:hypothetical protein
MEQACSADLEIGVGTNETRAQRPSGAVRHNTTRRRETGGFEPASFMSDLLHGAIRGAWRR